MTRCDYCEYRNSWDCEDDRKPDNILCDYFKLDFKTLSKKQRKALQMFILVNPEEAGEEE